MRHLMTVALMCVSPLLASCAGSGATWGKVGHPNETVRGTITPVVKDSGTAQYKRTRRLLEVTGSCTADNEPVERVLAWIAGKSEIKIFVNWTALQTAGVDQKTPVSVALKGCPWRSILTAVVSEVGGGTANLGYTIDDDGIMNVSTKEDLQSAKYQIVRVFDIGFLFDTVDPTERITDMICITESFGGVPNFTEPVGDQSVPDLIDSIKNSFAPDTWRDMGGIIGSIREIKGLLIINQTQDNMRQITALIDDMRAKAAARARVYDVRDLVGDDDKKLRQLMDLIEGISPARMWVERGGRMATMRGMNGRIFVSGGNHMHEQVESLLRVIRESGAADGRMNVVKPPLLPVPPQMLKPPVSVPATQPTTSP